LTTAAVPKLLVAHFEYLPAVQMSASTTVSETVIIDELIKLVLRIDDAQLDKFRLKKDEKGPQLLDGRVNDEIQR